MGSCSRPPLSPFSRSESLASAICLSSRTPTMKNSPLQSFFSPHPTPHSPSSDYPINTLWATTRVTTCRPEDPGKKEEDVITLIQGAAFGLTTGEILTSAPRESMIPSGRCRTRTPRLRARRARTRRPSGRCRTIGTYTLTVFEERFKLNLLSERFELLRRSLEQGKEKHLSPTLEPSSRVRQRHREMAGPGRENLSVHLSSSAEMPFRVEQEVLGLYFEHFKDKTRPAIEADVCDFLASKKKTHTPVEETTHFPQANSANHLRRKARDHEVIKMVADVVGHKGFLYHSTELEKIERALNPRRTSTATKMLTVLNDKTTTFFLNGVIGSFSNHQHGTQHLSTSVTILSACSHAYAKYEKGEWKASIDANGKFILVVIPPSVTDFLSEKRRLVTYYNDSYVRIEGICIPLQDMRGVPPDVTKKELARLLVPGCALVFEIKCSWDKETGQLV